MLPTVLPGRVAGVVVVDKGHCHLAPARIGVAVKAVLPVGDRAVLHALLEGEVEHRALGPIGPVLDDLLPARRVAPVPARIFRRAFPQLADAEAVVGTVGHPAVDPLRGEAADEIEAEAAGAVLAAQVGELVAEHAVDLRMAGIEVGIAADETIAVVAVVGVVARVGAVVAPEALASRQVDFLVRVAAVHVVGHHVVEHLHPGTAERTGRLTQLGIAAVAAVLVEVVPEVAFAAAGLAAFAPAGEVTPGHRHPDCREAVGRDRRGLLAEDVVPVVGRFADDVPVEALEDDFVAAVVAHPGRALAGLIGQCGKRQQDRRQYGGTQDVAHRNTPVLVLVRVSDGKAAGRG